MRTIQVINVRWFNATAWYGAYLSRLLREAGHETLVLGLEGTESFAKAREWGLEPQGFELNTGNPAKLVRLYAQLQRIVRDFKPDVVNCHRGEAFILWGMMRKSGSDFKLVRTRGDQRLPKNNLPNRWLHRSVADAVVATNTVMAEHFCHNLQVPSDKVHTIRGGVDTDRFYYDAAGRERIRKEFGYAPDHFVVGLLGRFDRVKGQKELIYAVSELYHKRGIRHIRLMLAGFETATAQSEVEGWIREAGIEDITLITGKRSDVNDCICAMDLGVIASLWSETIARAALEIMACERPLISTDVGVMPDLLPQDALCPKGDVPALADLIQKSISDADWREALRKHCVRSMETLSGQHFLESTLSLYRSL